MNLVSFKASYPAFNDDLAISQALSEAELIIRRYDIDDDAKELALSYLVAHLLAIAPNQGATEQTVLRVKSGTNEVQFSDKDNLNNDWLNSSSYGMKLKLLINPPVEQLGFGGFVV